MNITLISDTNNTVHSVKYKYQFTLFFFLWFQAAQDVSSLKNIAGETGKKITDIASSFITDLQDRILWLQFIMAMIQITSAKKGQK